MTERSSMTVVKAILGLGIITMGLSLSPVLPHSLLLTPPTVHVSGIYVFLIANF